MSDVIQTYKRLVLDIHTWIDDGSPFANHWCACFGEYDVDKHVATGTTQRKAIDELLDYYEQENGELHQ